MLYRVVLTLESFDEALKCDYSNGSESSTGLFSSGSV